MFLASKIQSGGIWLEIECLCLSWPLLAEEFNGLLKLLNIGGMSRHTAVVKILLQRGQNLASVPPSLARHFFAYQEKQVWPIETSMNDQSQSIAVVSDTFQLRQN